MSISSDFLSLTGCHNLNACYIEILFCKNGGVVSVAYQNSPSPLPGCGKQ